jgi:CDP-diacylglycerol--glycerol-3-phosphate 3-phosphatidyltransferase
MTAVSPLPNILTWGRIVAGLATFGLLASAVLVPDLEGDTQFLLEKLAVIVFVVGAITDFFDGLLARKLHAETAWGATLDPIADKILVCGAILGMFALGQDNKLLALPAALILFREFTVSSLRESAAARGVKLPVTMLAKWKTTVQLVALLAELILLCGPAFGLDIDLAIIGPVAHGLLWLAAIITLWTGWDYIRAARKALPHEQ